MNAGTAMRGTSLLLLLLACGPRRPDDATANPEPTPTPTPPPDADGAAGRSPGVDTDGAPAAAEPDASDVPAVSHEVLARSKDHFMRGIQAFERRDFELALTEFQSSQLLVPRAHTRLNIARCRDHLGDLAGARTELLAVLSSKDEDEELRTAAADLLAAVERKMGLPVPNPPK